MQAAASAAPAGEVLVGKKELAARLNWSRPTLDRRLEQDPNFPVARRGSRIGGWGFDVAAVESYLEGGVLTRTAPAAREEPRGGSEHKGEATARQRKDVAQAALFEDRLRRQRGELVEADRMRMALSAVLAHLGQSLTALPDKIVRELSLPELAAPRIRSMVDAMRRTAVDELRDLLAEDE